MMTFRIARRAAVAIIALAATACAPTAPTSKADAPTPDWLRARTASYEAGPETEAPSAIWQIQHQGQTAYYVASPCCDQFNSLWNAKGDLVCHPDGGFTGRGEGMCPAPRDAGTPAKLIWSDPRKPAPDAAPFQP